MVIRTPVGGGIRGGHYHSQSPEAYFIHTPGLKVVCPSNPYDAKGLLARRIATTTRCSSSSRSGCTAR
jgi:pyruvate dehydrogenase E1 component beta subunit